VERRLDEASFLGPRWAMSRNPRRSWATTLNPRSAVAGIWWCHVETASLWLPASGQVLEIPLDPALWIAKVCEIVGRELTQDERDFFVPARPHLECPGPRPGHSCARRPACDLRPCHQASDRSYGQP
jgi:hypothetical protein